MWIRARQQLRLHMELLYSGKRQQRHGHRYPPAYMDTHHPGTRVLPPFSRQAFGTPHGRHAESLCTTSYMTLASQKSSPSFSQLPASICTLYIGSGPFMLGSRDSLHLSTILSSSSTMQGLQNQYHRPAFRIGVFEKIIVGVTAVWSTLQHNFQPAPCRFSSISGYHFFVDSVSHPYRGTCAARCFLVCCITQRTVTSQLSLVNSTYSAKRRCEISSRASAIMILWAAKFLARMKGF